MIRLPLIATLSALLAALAVVVPAGDALADTPTSPATEAAAPATTTTTNVPAPASPEPSSTGTTATPSVSETPTTSTSTPSEGTTTVPAPEVRIQRSQPRTTTTRVHRGSATTRRSTKSKTGTNAKGGTNANGGTNPKGVSPSALTPPLPSALGGSLSNLPSFYINSFSIPPFLLPIYQAAGAAYGIPWQVLAAINEVETDYGRDLSLSSAGAEGWMQFLPSEWGQYGVDVNDSGVEDPYNPADAIFAAARYLKDAGGDTDIRAAVFAYNHSQAYVSSVMLRARLLGGTPPELLGAITGLTEARFPVYAASHYSDGFPTTEGPSPHSVPAATIYSQAGAPVIAVQDGRITQIDSTGPFGPSISLVDAYGNTYTYAGLGTLASLYPVLESVEGAPRAAGLAGVVSNAGSTSPANGATRVFRVGTENVYLHPLRVGAQVIAGTVLGHLGSDAEPHLVFQIRPAGIGAPLIDPKPILDGWVKLQISSAVRSKNRALLAVASPSPGQALLESKTQLELQIQHDRGVHLASCERHLIADGRADRRVLGVLEFLSASGLRPTVSARGCSQATTAESGVSSTNLAGETVDISAIDGVPIAGPSGPSSLAVAAVHKLGGLQGVMKPLEIASSTRFEGPVHTVALPGDTGVIEIAFTSLDGGGAHAASVSSSGLNPAQWLELVARLGQVPDPTVSSKPSPAAIPDSPAAGASTAAEGK
ncbi:MAG TPA: lytic murein transglycosylase [Solirubrobacteraceae bacterium]